MTDAGILQNKGPRTAFVLCTNVQGGHEFQSLNLIEDYARHMDVTVHLNRQEDLSLFENCGLIVKVNQELFLTKGWMLIQVVNAILRMKKIRAVLSGYDRVVICAGSVEAGICTSVALMGRKHITLYLPSFFDRSLIWGGGGHLYNFLLARFGFFYENIITINRIQALIIKNRMWRPTMVVPNKINEVPIAPKSESRRILIIGRLDVQKRVAELLDWLDFKENPYSHVLIIGDGPEKDKIKAQISLLKHIDATLLGWTTGEEQNKIIEGNDVLILNSLVEGEPLVIREANLREILVISRNIIGVRGITSKKNRFNNREELHKRLNESINGDLNFFRRAHLQFPLPPKK